MNHYVYLLQNMMSTMHYIGCRSCHCPVGEDPYMGSSSVMTKEEKAGCNKIILKRFSSREEAIAYEIRLHNEFDVAKNPLFWNKAKQTSTGFDRTGTEVPEGVLNKYYRGKVFSEEHRRRLSEAGKGREFSKEHRKKIGDAHRGKVVKEESKRYGSANPMFGRLVTEAVRKKISTAGTKFPDRYIWYNKETKEELCKTCLEMGKMFDPHKQSSSFTKIVKGQMKSIYKWTLKG